MSRVFGGISIHFRESYKPRQGVHRRMVLVVNIFACFKFIFRLVVAIFDLVHDVEALFYLP